MKERIVEIETPDGRIETFITHPELGGPDLAREFGTLLRESRRRADGEG